MKPVKKNRQGAKTSELNEIKSSTKIPNFFKTTPKPIIREKIDEFVASEQITKFENTKPIYVKLLMKKLQNDVEAVADDDTKATADKKMVSSVVHEEATDEDTTIGKPECTRCKDLEEKYKEWKKKYAKLAIRFSEIQLMYNDLLQTKTYHSAEQDGEVTLSDGIFTPNELQYLRAMKGDKSKDSTFILKCLEFAYKTDHSVLQQRTLLGKPESAKFNEHGEIVVQLAEKYPLTPMKVERITQLFTDRISKSNCGPVAYGERISDANLHKLIATGILNICKRQKK